MRSAERGVKMVVAIAVLALISAFLIPTAINQIEGERSVTITQNTSETEAVNAELDATLDSVDTTGDTATYTLNTSSQSISKTVDNGTTATYAFDRGDVNVTVQDVSTGEATSQFDYPKDFPYSDGARSLWSILGLVIVLALMLFGLRKGMDAY